MANVRETPRYKPLHATLTKPATSPCQAGALHRNEPVSTPAHAAPGHHSYDGKKQRASSMEQRGDTALSTDMAVGSGCSARVHSA